MPATAAKYLDMQEVTLTIPIGQTTDDASVGHNLAKANSNNTGYEYVNPDMVVLEIVGGSQTTAPLLTVARPVTPNGGLTIAASIAAPSGSQQTIYCRVTSIYWHSMHGTDHTI